jgi:predicted Ser/Thr protein kinase
VTASGSRDDRTAENNGVMTDRVSPLPGSPASSAKATETTTPPDKHADPPPAAGGEAFPQASPFLRSGAPLFALPAQFGRYRLDKLLGKGGMGAVYLAYDTQLERPVALKVPSFGPDEGDLRERFLREGRAAATLHHPNICPVFDIGEHDGVHFLTMAYVEGKPLSDFVSAKKPIPAATAANLVRQLARAMQEAHDRGIIHRDLKPANVLINRKKEPVIMDFGLARRAASQDERLTHSGAIMGTPAYMPPEQVNGDVAAMGPGCDIYSLGVILYELLAGRRPFEGPLGALMAQIVLDSPPPLSQFRPDVDPALEALCQKALAKRPSDRFASMRSFAQALEAWLGGKSLPAPKVAPPRPVTRPAEPAEDESVTETVAPVVTRRPAAPARTTRKRPRRKFRLSPAQKGVLTICLIVLVTCGLPIGAVIMMVIHAFGKVPKVVGDGVRQVQTALEDEKTKQEELRAWRKEEQKQWTEAARDWQAPPADIGTDELFPATLAGYQLGEVDDQANVPALNLAHKGHHAVYQGPAGKVEFYAYRANRQQKESLFHLAREAVSRRGGLPILLGPGGASVHGSVDGIYLSYDLGPAETPACQYGTLWWKADWLFLARGDTEKEPGAFLKEYLAQIGGLRGRRTPPQPADKP